MSDDGRTEPSGPAWPLPGDTRTCPDIKGRDLPTVSNPDPCGGGDLPGLRDKYVHVGQHSAYCKQCWPNNGTPKQAGSLKEQARTLVDGERQADYGEPVEHMRRVADAWSAVLRRPITPEEVCLCLATLKLVREGHRPKRDNREDAIGYLDILERVHSHGA